MRRRSSTLHLGRLLATKEVIEYVLPVTLASEEQIEYVALLTLASEELIEYVAPWHSANRTTLFRLGDQFTTVLRDASAHCRDGVMTSGSSTLACTLIM